MKLCKELRETAGDAGNGLDRESRAAIDEAADEIERLREALKDIQKEAMTLKPPRHSWYYDRAQNALTNSTEPLVRDGLAAPPQS